MCFVIKKLFDDFMELNLDNRMFQEGMFDTRGYGLKDGNYLVIFNTHGTNYRTELIEIIISQYHNTKWYCIEENDVEEGAFFLTKQKAI
jgi:hypothetical protein